MAGALSLSAQTSKIHISNDTRDDLPIVRVDPVYSNAGGLPAAASYTDKVIVVTDTNGSDCETSGSTIAWCKSDGANWVMFSAGGGGGSSAFADLTAGTNTTAAMVVGSGASLAASGSGSITATLGDSATAFFGVGQIEVSRGGTGADLSGTGGANQILKQSSAGGPVSVGQLNFTELAGTVSAAQAANVKSADLADVGCTTVSYSATPTFDAATGGCFEITLTGNVTSSTLSNEAPGTEVFWVIKQDATGSRTFTWPVEVGDACAIASASNAVTIVKATVDNDGVTAIDCHVKSGSDAWSFACVNPSTIPTPPAGETTLFCDSTNSNELSSKDSSGTVVSHESGGAGGGVGGNGVWQTFTSVTSVTINHNFDSLAYTVECIDGSGGRINFADYTTRTTSTVTVDFAGQSLTGGCAAIPGGAPGPYVESFSSVTTLTVLGSTHSKGCSPVVALYDNGTPRNAFTAGYTVDDPATCDIDFDFGSAAVSGKAVITSAAGGDGSGTVTSVALTAPAILSVSGSPVTTSGTLALSLANQTANTLFAGPSSGAAAAPAFRALVDDDVPNTITINLAAAATALAADPADCAANQVATAINASGTLSCVALSDAYIPDSITITLAATATALAANPTDCAAGAFANSIDASGNLTCIAPNAGTDVTADLEEETHASEHSENAADEILGENLGTACAENQILKADATGGLVCAADATGGSPTFDGIGGGTNTTAAMVVGTGSSLSASGSGTITATAVAADSVALTTGTTGNYVASVATTAPITGGAAGSEGATLTIALNQNAGTDVTADLEEETHAAEHSLGGGDAITATNLASSCTDAQVLGGTGAGTGVECQTDDDVPESGDFGAAADLEADGSISPAARKKVIIIEVFPPGTDTATGDGKKYIPIPAELNAHNLTGINSHVISTGTTGTLNIDIARCAAVATGNTCSGAVSDMLSTNQTIDSGESKSATAAAAAVIDTANDDVSTDQVIRVDVDAVHTTAAQGLVVMLEFTPQ